MAGIRQGMARTVTLVLICFGTIAGPSRAQFSSGAVGDHAVKKSQDPISGSIQEAKPKRDPDMLPEYDSSHGVRGKYAKRYAEGTNIVVLAPDIAEFFSDSEAVNNALRALVEIARKSERNAGI